MAEQVGGLAGLHLLKMGHAFIGTLKTGTQKAPHPVPVLCANRDTDGG